MKQIVMKREFAEGSKGHLSARLRTIQQDGSIVETHYDTRLHDSNPPVNSKIYIYDSQTGIYEECSCLAHAKQLIEEHKQRLRIPLSAKRVIPKMVEDGMDVDVPTTIRVNLI